MAPKTVMRKAAMKGAMKKAAMKSAMKKGAMKKAMKKGKPGKDYDVKIVGGRQKEFRPLSGAQIVSYFRPLTCVAAIMYHAVSKRILPW